jgi:threonine dehydratase
MISINEIRKAKDKIKEVVHYTPLDHSQTFSELTQNEVYLKLENLQKTGSFKIRGAYNKILSLIQDEKSRGVIAASAGNHAQGVALASKIAGIHCTIVMPEGASLSKIEATKKYGAQVILHGKYFDDAMEKAQQIHKETGASFIHAFDDEKIIAGQGTVGLEVLEQLSDVEAVICPIGGGGLISGIAVAIKSINPTVKIYGVQAAACPSMIASRKEKMPIKVPSTGTIADGIAVKKPGKLTFDIVNNYVDTIITVDENEISQTMLYLLERNKFMVEGSGAASLAALLYKKIPLTNKKVVNIISGGNVDSLSLSRIIEHGLIESGRFMKFVTVGPDKPGLLHKLLQVVSEHKANIISVQHNRISSKIPLGHVEIEVALETNNIEHIENIKRNLEGIGYVIKLYI